ISCKVAIRPPTQALLRVSVEDLVDLKTLARPMDSARSMAQWRQPPTVSRSNTHGWRRRRSLRRRRPCDHAGCSLYREPWRAPVLPNLKWPWRIDAIHEVLGFALRENFADQRAPSRLLASNPHLRLQCKALPTRRHPTL